MIQRSTWPN